MVKLKRYWKAGLVILTVLSFSFAVQAPSQATTAATAQQTGVAIGWSAGYQAGGNPAGIWAGYSAGYTLNADERQLLGLINQERVANHLPVFTVSLRLSYLARLRAQEMDDIQILTHFLPVYGTPPQMEEAAGLTGKLYGAENIVRAPDVASGNQALFNSPPHRANLLDPRETEIGLGVVRDHNGIWVSELFMAD